MKTLNKVFAAVGSLVLAMALMVPTLAWADGEGKAIRMNYEGVPIVLPEFEGTPYSVLITFHVDADYNGYADADKKVEFTLADTPEMKKLRVASEVRNADDSYTVILSNGNKALPLTDDSYLDLGTLDVKINDTLDEGSENEDAMRKASVVVTALETSDSMFRTARSIGGTGASSAEKVVPFTLANASFESVTTGTPGQTTDPGQTPGGDGGSGGGTDNSGDQANQANKANQPSQKAAPIRRLEPIGGNLATTGDQNMPIVLIVVAVAACAAVAATAFVFTRKKKGSE